MAALEEVWALDIFGSSRSILAIVNCMTAGDNLSLLLSYGGTYNQFRVQFPRLGIEVKFADGDSIDSFRNKLMIKPKQYMSNQWEILGSTSQILRDSLALRRKMEFP